MSSRIILIFIILICVTDGFGCFTAESEAQNPAYTWRDTLYVRIADSLYDEDTQAIEFTLEMKRPNADWNNDAVLGDMDFYFFYDRTAFNPATGVPLFLSTHPALDLSTAGVRNNLVSAETRFHAGRFLVSTRVTHNVAGAGKYEFSVDDGWVELCRVTVPMSDGNRNPGLVWDEIATGAMTAGGDPILLKLMGDVKNNPKGTVNATSLVVAPEYVCQGDLLYLYVEDALTSGNALEFTWRDSVTNGNATTLGTFNAAATGTSPRGYEYQVLGKGDTLVIPNVPGVLDKLNFICDLYDASVRDGMTVTGDVKVRDSLYAYFASTTPSTPVGMSADIDTIWKCQGSPAQLNIHVFGADRNEIRTEFGPKLTIHYGFIDKDMNAQTGEVEVAVNDLFQHQKTENSLTGGILYTTSISLEQSGKFWINSITNEYCSNGIGYIPFDTVFIKEVEGNIEYNLPKLSVSIGEQVALDTAVAGDKNYTVSLLHDPSLIGGAIYEDGGVWKYDAGVATAGVDTVVYTYQQASCDMKAFRPMEVVENYYLTMKVLLEGPYLGLDANGNDTMRCEYTEQESFYVNCFPRTNLRKLVSPYDENCVLENSVESMVDVRVPGTICDWIYIKLREEAEEGGIGANYVDSISAFVLNNGEVVGIDGNPVKFKNVKQKVYIEIIHRNHLQVISGQAKQLPTSIEPGVLFIDFTKVETVYIGENSLKKVFGKYCIPAGDIDMNGFVEVSDQAKVKLNRGMQYDYDIDHNFFVEVQDANMVLNNRGRQTYVP